MSSISVELFIDGLETKFVIFFKFFIILGLQAEKRLVAIAIASTG
jgi:hypothetical protein